MVADKRALIAELVEKLSALDAADAAGHLPCDVGGDDGLGSVAETEHASTSTRSLTGQCEQWHNDGVAAASSDGGPTGGRGPPTVCLVLLSNCYIIIHCTVWF